MQTRWPPPTDWQVAWGGGGVEKHGPPFSIPVASWTAPILHLCPTLSPILLPSAFQSLVPTSCLSSHPSCTAPGVPGCSDHCAFDITHPSRQMSHGSPGLGRSCTLRKGASWPKVWLWEASGILQNTPSGIHLPEYAFQNTLPEYTSGIHLPEYIFRNTLPEYTGSGIAASEQAR